MEYFLLIFIKFANQFSIVWHNLNAIIKYRSSWRFIRVLCKRESAKTHPTNPTVFDTRPCYQYNDDSFVEILLFLVNPALILET